MRIIPAAIFFATLFLPETSFALGKGLPARPCQPVISEPVRGPLPSAISKSDPTRSKLIADTTVKNQGDYGCCWISSVLGSWERLTKNRFGREVKLSENHMILASLFYRLEEGIYNGQEIFQGGWMESADWMATHIGLVPEEAYQWKIDLRDKNVGDEIVGYLNFEVAKFQATLGAMKKTGASEKEAWDFAQKTKNRLMKYLRGRVGNFPSSFVFEGKKYTPHSFAAEFNSAYGPWERVSIEPLEARVPRQEVLDPDVVTEEKSLFGRYPESWRRLPVSKNKVVLEEGRKLRSLQRYRLYGRSHAERYRESKAAMPSIHAAIEASIDNGEPVYLSTAMVKAYYKNETGLMSIAANGGTLKEAKKAKFSGGHAVLITGAYFDGAGNLLGYRIQNSWGTERGTLGYYYMDLDYFETFMDGILIKKKIEASANPKISAI